MERVTTKRQTYIKLLHAPGKVVIDTGGCVIVFAILEEHQAALGNQMRTSGMKNQPPWFLPKQRKGSQHHLLGIIGGDRLQITCMSCWVSALFLEQASGLLRLTKQ